MSHKEKMTELRQHLESWKHSVDVHSSHSNDALYEFLSKLLKTGEGDEISISNEDAAASETKNSTDDGEGGNSPSDPPVLP